jgi:hypothetical protein
MSDAEDDFMCEEEDEDYGLVRVNCGYRFRIRCDKWNIQ